MGPACRRDLFDICCAVTRKDVFGGQFQFRRVRGGSLMEESNLNYVHFKNEIVLYYLFSVIN